jgi:hypothetical protein
MFARTGTMVRIVLHIHSNQRLNHSVTKGERIGRALKGP